MDSNDVTGQHDRSRWNHLPRDVPSRGGLWDSWFRLISSFALGVLSAIYIAGGKSRDVSDLVAWRGKVEAKLEAMDGLGTQFGRAKLEEHTRDLAKFEARLEHVEADTRHVEVLESENRRLTADVERLKQKK